MEDVRAPGNQARGEPVRAYLDHAASSPLRPELIGLMADLASKGLGNPTSQHLAGRRAKRVLEDAREKLAEVLRVHPSEVIFTSGGTESDNMAVLGVSGELFTSELEHPAVREPAKRKGATFIPAQPGGTMDLDFLEQRLAHSPEAPGLVSVMAVNNETGILQPLGEVAEAIASKSPGTLLHTDAVQASAWCDLAQLCQLADLVSLSAHKVGGPVGVGLLVVRDPVKRSQIQSLEGSSPTHISRAVHLEPIMLGGGQESGLRPGTPNAIGAAMAAEAIAKAQSERPALWGAASRWRSRLTEAAKRAGAASGVEVVATGHPSNSVPGICHLRFMGIQAEELLFLLDRLGVSASAGSACASGALEESHVLRAMGWSGPGLREALRFSFGWSTTEEEVDHACWALEQALGTMAEAGAS
jgi:cysteine desulfurase